MTLVGGQLPAKQLVLTISGFAFPRITLSSSLLLVKFVGFQTLLIVG